MIVHFLTETTNVRHWAQRLRLKLLCPDKILRGLNNLPICQVTILSVNYFNFLITSRAACCEVQIQWISLSMVLNRMQIWPPHTSQTPPPSTHSVQSRATVVLPHNPLLAIHASTIKGTHFGVLSNLLNISLPVSSWHLLCPSLSLSAKRSLRGAQAVSRGANRWELIGVAVLRSQNHICVWGHSAGTSAIQSTRANSIHSAKGRGLME